MYQNNYNLNFVPGGVPLTIHISQYDVGTRTFHFTPIAVPGTVTTFTGATATLEATKPDGYAVIQECTYNGDGTIDYTVQEQLAAKAGKVWSKIVLRDGTDVIGTAAIVWIVDKAGVTDDAIVSDSDVSGIRGLVEAEVRNALATALPVGKASGAIASFTDGADNVPVEDLKISIIPQQSGSGDPSPSNVRPITGWTGANVVRAGKNLIDDSIKTVQSASTCVIGQTSTSEFNVYLPAGTYTVSFGSSKAPGIYYRLSTESSGSHNVITYGNKTGSFTLTANAHLRIWAYLSAGIAPADIDWFQIEPGSTATEYEPYTAQTYSISFGSAGTVYGGTLDVTTGVLTVDKKMITVDGTNVKMTAKGSSAPINYYFNTPDGYLFDMTGSGWLPRRFSNENYLRSDRFKMIYYSDFEAYGFALSAYIGSGGTVLQPRFIFPESANITTVAEANAWFVSNPTTLVYPLAAPTTYQLTPTEVRTLLGNNNIWADTGDTEVAYRADTARYIDSRINAQQKIISGVETSYTATKNYAIGDYVIVNDTLYKVTAAIASGATITPGTNATATTVAEQLILLANA